MVVFGSANDFSRSHGIWAKAIVKTQSGSANPNSAKDLIILFPP